MPDDIVPLTLPVFPREFVFVSIVTRVPGLSTRLTCAILASAAIVGVSSAQTAPQLLPYTSKVIAGGGTTVAAAGATCAGPAGAAPSGNVSSNAIGDNCLATEVPTSVLAIGTNAARYAITDASGAIYISDFANNRIRRIDATTGIITTIAGGGTNVAAGANCSSNDAAHKALAADVWSDGCLGTEVRLGSATGKGFSGGMAFSPSTVANPSGDLYFVDNYNYNIRKMSFTNGGVAAVIVTNPGAGYATAPTVTFSAPAGGGTTATGTATINASGTVTGVTIVNPGSGYTAAVLPTVTFTASGSGVAAAGTAVYTGVITMAAGSLNGGSASSTAYGFNSGCNAALAPTTTFVAATPAAPTPCVLRGPYGINFDAAGNLYIAEEYYQAVLVLNTNTTGSTTVEGQTIPAQNMVKIVGAQTSGAACLNSTAATKTGTGGGCFYAVFTNGTAANVSQLDNPYAVALDSSSNLYIANEYYNDIAAVGASTAAINNFAGSYPLSGTGKIQPQTQRAPAGTFTIGSTFGVATDATNNIYFTDALAGYVWRVDAVTNSMYVVGGGGATTTAGSPCASNGIGAQFTATDAYGDGCPGLLANFSKSGTSYASNGIGVYGISTDTYGNVFVGDTNNGLVRELASGTQFGTTGAVATDYIAIHFAAGDTPVTASGTTVPFAITSGASVFTVGSPTCTLNSDTTTDCIVPVTASPTVAGPYSGTLSVVSTKSPTPVNFALTGIFTKSPNTRLSLSFASTTTTCGTATTFSNADTVALTATLTLSGPVPSGTITFSATPSGGTAAQIGTPQSVVNIGTAGNPVYGAVLRYTFSTPGSYTISAVYSGDTAAPTYYKGSSASTQTNALISTAPTFTLSPTTDGTTTVHGGCPPGQIGQCVIAPGQTALYSLTLTETVYTGTITFSCSGAPANASCVVAPTSLTATGCSTSGTLAVSVLTSGGVPAQTAIGLPGSGPWQLLSMALGIVLALMIGLRRRRVHLRGLWMALALLLAGSGLVGCNSGVTGLPVTPKGTYTITVTATGSTGTTSSVALPLTIQ